MKSRKASQVTAVIAVAVMVVAGVAVEKLAEGPITDLYNPVPRGEAVDLSHLDTDTYQVSEVTQAKDGRYVVQSTARGFKSDITVQTVFSPDASTIESINIVSQDETDGIGSHITDASFVQEFTSLKAPIMLDGMTVASPAGGTGQQTTGEDEAVLVSNPGVWNASDQSAEAKSYRALYAAGMTLSRIEGEPIKTPEADLSVEDQTQNKMLAAGLIHPDSAKKTDASQTGNVHRKAATKSEKVLAAELSVATEEAEATEEKKDENTVVDGVSGATFSSTGVVTAIDNAYFFLTEQVLK